MPFINSSTRPFAPIIKQPGRAPPTIPSRATSCKFPGKLSEKSLRVLSATGVPPVRSAQTAFHPASHASSLKNREASELDSRPPGGPQEPQPVEPHHQSYSPPHHRLPRLPQNSLRLRISARAPKLPPNAPDATAKKIRQLPYRKWPRTLLGSNGSALHPDRGRRVAQVGVQPTWAAKPQEASRIRSRRTTRLPKPTSQPPAPPDEVSSRKAGPSVASPTRQSPIDQHNAQGDNDLRNMSPVA